ncbi:ATP-binding protein [Vibrio sp. AND4]|uniref:ATP-binding protein n=1 Tax=Vibrio sp. AND4 TaxID=314289 RepID=UPI00015F3181|nr:ATP-binding protein [Vibrio sp. AND4]EDP60396.1 sensory box sensor histidine kinase/response regulator VieS [Vibrio sp. AND4]
MTIKKYLLLMLCVLSFDTVAKIEETHLPTRVKIGVPSTPIMPYWGGSVILPTGIIEDILNIIEVQLNVEFNYVPLDSIVDIEQALRDRTIDLAISFQRDDEKTSDFINSDFLFFDTVVGWISPNAKNKSFDTLIWGCWENSIFCKLAKDSGYKIKALKDSENFHESIEKKEIDSVIGLYNVIRYYFLDEEEIVFNDNFGEVGFFFSFPESNSFYNDLQIFISKFRNQRDVFYYEGVNKEYNVNLDDKKLSDYSGKVIKYTMRDDIFPYFYFDKEKNEYAGYVYDMLNDIQSITPLSFVYIPLNGRNSEEMLENGIVDLIPIGTERSHVNKSLEDTKTMIEVQFSYVEAKKNNRNSKVGIYDRFGYYYYKSNNENLVNYNDIRQLILDLKQGLLAGAYINKQLLESLVYYDKEFDLNISYDDENKDLEVFIPMIIRKGDVVTRRLIEESFNMLSKRNLKKNIDQYSKVKYNIGYNKVYIKTLLFFVIMIFGIITFLYYLYAFSLKKKVEGAQKEVKLSEVQSRWLLKIINNLSSAVCITDSKGNVLLTNKEFVKLKENYSFKEDYSFVKHLLDITNTQIFDDFTLDFSMFMPNCDETEKFYNIVNSSISHYLEKVELHMLVVSNVTLQKEREKMLTQMSLDAEKSLIQKKNFLAIISHELRTPISGIAGILELLQKSSQDEVMSEMLFNAIASSNKLKLLVDDILDFSKLDADQLSLNLESVNIVTDICPIIKGFEVSAQNKGLDFIVDWVPSNVIYFEIDILRFTQIISNVLSNAIKFTNEGEVEIRVILTTNKIKVIIKDSGIGMTREEQIKVFDPFVQAQDNITRKYGGTGLGMSIVKNLINMMSGSITLDSSVGIGTTVTLEIEAESQKLDFGNENYYHTVRDKKLADWLNALRLSYESCSDFRDIDNHHNFYPDTIFHTLSECRTDNRAVLSSSVLLSGRALVVDDDPLNQFVIMKQLDSLNVNYEIVENGIEALKVLNSSFDLILTDYHMPKMNGLELIKEIRSSSNEYNKIPIIICTADNSETVSDNLDSKIVDSILYKPYSLIDLSKILSKFLPTATSSTNETYDFKLGLGSWFENINEKDKVTMAQAIVSSLNLSINDLINHTNNNTIVRDTVHRLKGTIGILELNGIMNLCERLEKTPSNTNAINDLIKELNFIIDEAKRYF